MFGWMWDLRTILKCSGWRFQRAGYAQGLAWSSDLVVGLLLPHCLQEETHIAAVVVVREVLASAEHPLARGQQYIQIDLFGR